MIFVIPVLFLIFFLYSIKNTHNITKDSQYLSKKLNDINNEYKTNFIIDLQILSKIFFDTYQCKIYFNDVPNFSGIKDFSILKSWEIVQSSENDSAYILLIYTTELDEQPIEIEYGSYEQAKADLYKLNSLMYLITH